MKRTYRVLRDHSGIETNNSGGVVATHVLKITGKDDLLISQSNPRNKDGYYKKGGDFLVIKNECHDGVLSPGKIQGGSSIPSGRRFYYGSHFATGNIGVNDWPIAIFPSNPELDADGSTAIAATLPTNPISGLAVTLGELKTEGIPNLHGIQTWKGRTSAARSAGGEYLNHQFGWVPLVNEMRDFSRAVTDSDELVRRFDRNSGRNTKVRFDFPTSTDVTGQSEVVGDGFKHITPFPGLDVRYYEGTNGASKRTTTTRVIRRKWFEGCYTYYVPPYKPNGDNTKRNLQLARYLYGLEVTPDVIWNLTPWSWAVDWVTNFGSVFHNLSAFSQDGLVMRYGFIMSETIHEKEVTISGFGFKTTGAKRYTLSTTTRTIVKQRRKATPYGFGLDFDGFTPKQLSILAALGLSK